MTGSSTTANPLAVALVLAVTVLCLGDLAQAFMPNAEDASCVTRLCDGQTGCAAAAPSPVALPTATLGSVDTTIGLAAPLFVLQLVERPGVPGPQVVPLAPRSPPAA